MGGITGSGSPLEARQSALPYTVLLAAMVLIGILAVIWIISKIIKNYKQSPAYIEKLKQRPTTLADVQALAKKINLTRAEVALLFNICRREKAKNIYYTWNDSETLDSLFKNEFKRLKNGNVSDEEMAAFFKLRSHFERLLLVKKSISSSHLIPPGEHLKFSASAGIEYDFKIFKNEKDNLVLEAPKDLETKDFCPKPLTKIMMTYHTANGLKYVLTTRVIRFQNGPNDTRQMVVQHANTVSMQSRRRYKRAKVGIDCSFSGVEEIQGKKGEVSYNPKANKYHGKLVDISAGGCSIMTKLPIKRNQKIWIEIELSGCEKIQCCGLIVAVTQKEDNYSLHISFLNLTGKEHNEIFSYVYNYT